MKKRTFGWVQNPGDLKKLKKVVGVFSRGSKENLWLIEERLPLLLRYGLISHANFTLFSAEMKRELIEVNYALLKGKGAGSAGRANALCTGIYRGRTYTAGLQTYSITRAGEKALIKARGNSSHPRLPRVLMFEMLASNKAHGADYLRYQRAAIIKALSSAEKTLEQLKTSLKEYGLEVDADTIKDHIEGLRSIGVDIASHGQKLQAAGLHNAPCAAGPLCLR